MRSSLHFLSDLGYKNISSKTYPNMKHEILNEEDKDVVYEDILEFIE